MQTRYTISHAAYTGSMDSDGYPTGDDYSDPVDRSVFGWYPSSGHSSLSASHMSASEDYERRVTTARVVLVPDVSPYSVRDRIILPGDDTPYFVSEDVRDYTMGPFGFKPGGEIVIEKVTG